MAGKNESPRQKMIGMMYLVLTALLALNVAKEILDAFVLVNDGLQATNRNFQQKISHQYAAFEKALLLDEKKVRPFHEKAKNVKARSEEMMAEIEALKKELVTITEGLPKETGDTLSLKWVGKKDNFDIPTQILIGNSEDVSRGKAFALKQKINAYKEFLFSILDPIDRPNMDLGLDTRDPVNSPTNENWELYNFYHLPLVAVVTNLSRIQNDIKKAESDVVEYLYKKVNADDFVFDTIVAKVIPRSNYILMGEEYRADVFLAAYNTTKNPEIRAGFLQGKSQSPGLNPDPIPVEDGTGKFIFKANKEGLQKWGGAITIENSNGEKKSYPFESEFLVARPSASISPTLMNVLYMGIPNPLSVSVPGIPSEDLIVSIDKGGISKNGSEYIASQLTPGFANINVSAKMENGKTMPMGSMKFRVLLLPRPVVRFGNHLGLLTPLSLIKKEGKLTGAYPDGTAINASPEVKSFTMVVPGPGGVEQSYESKTGYLTDDMKKILDVLKNGTRVYFENVVVEGPDKIKHRLDFQIKLAK
jgi:gliding motility-associated protein GldM